MKAKGAIIISSGADDDVLVLVVVHDMVLFGRAKAYMVNSESSCSFKVRSSFVSESMIFA